MKTWPMRLLWCYLAFSISYFVGSCIGCAQSQYLPQHEVTVTYPGNPPRGYLTGVLDMDAIPVFSTLVERAITEKAASLVFQIDSPGGNLLAAMRIAQLMDAAREAHIRIDCVVDGRASSAAFFVLQSCDRRMMTKRSTLMVHQPSIELNNAESAKDPHIVENLQNASHAIAVAVAEQNIMKMRIKLDAYQKRVEDGREWWLDWTEALNWGAVDFVVESTRRLPL